VKIQAVSYSYFINKQLIKFAGGFAGVMSWLLTHPADVVKSRIQAQDRFLVRFYYFLGVAIK
jgi:hypothetical protein